ncbi:MAG: SDR family NAD(P)-dependent oxidoreductase [Deltaproteobacteria bacterium]|jgi:3-oxoacyl-(acyl-carrier-protein) synthase/acyl carrier protein/NADP-dependent 3-hydroxy acid dehydrogenase YdfG|nr:SDR family NAD(P)-dependent oxidoreductase [Deltaproteobacteria bacterium]
MSYELETRFDSQELNRGVAVIGLGALFPGRPGLAGFWSAIKRGLDAITEVPLDRFDPRDYFDADPKARDRMYCRRGAFLSPTPFEPLKFGIAPRDLESIDSSQLLGLVVADAALNDAGYPADRADHARTAVVMGVTGGLEMLGHMSARTAFPQVRRALERSGLSAGLIEEILENYGEEFAPWREGSFPGLLGNVVSGRIANRLNLGGANMVVDAACASSLAAVGQAVLELRSGRADLVVTGGIDTFTDPFMFTCFCKTPALSPTEEARPYDQAADGTLLGEGLGALVLKRLADAVKDQDRVYAVIRGLGASSDGRGASIFAPSAQGQLRAMEAAYQEAGFSPTSVELVEGHGTGTQAGDAAELAALTELFGARRPAGINDSFCALGSVKSQIGHAKAAAGAAGLIKVVLSLYHKVLPPSIKAKNPAKALLAPDCPLYLNAEARPWLAQPLHPRRGAVSAFGFGGANFHCLLEEGPAPKPLDEAGQSLIPLSGPNPRSLLAKLEELSFVDDPLELDARVRPLYRLYRPQDPARLVMAGSFDQIAEAWPLAMSLLADLERAQSPEWPANLHWGEAGEAKSLRLLAFPQGFWPDQGRELALAFPAFHQALDLASLKSPFPLGKTLFPPILASTFSQPPEGALAYLGAVQSLALSALWASLGLPLASAEGFGQGFLAAAYLAGSVSLEGALSLARGLAERDRDRELLLSSIVWAPPRIPLWADDQEIKTQADLKAAMGRLLEGSDPLLPEYHKDPQDAYLVLGRHESLAGRDCHALKDGEWTMAALAQVVAALASGGHRLDLNAWPTGPAPSPTPQGHFVNLTGANFFNAKKAEKALTRPSAPLVEPRRPAAQKALTEAEVGTFRDLVALQAETMAALKDLALEMKLARTQGLGVTPPNAAPAAGARPAALAPDEPERRIAERRAQERRTLERRFLGPEAAAAPNPLAADPIPFPAPGLTPGPAPALTQAGGQTETDPEAQAAAWAAVAEILARETGYPAEALSESMGLEEDLGLDSIKRMELFAALADRFPNLKTAEANPATLGDLARLCQEPQGSNGPHGPAAAMAPEPGLARADLDPGPLALAVLAQETGYPAESLKPEMSLESDLGLDSIKRVEILASLADRLPGLDPAALSGAATLGQLIDELQKQVSRGQGQTASLSSSSGQASPIDGPGPGPRAAGPAFGPSQVLEVVAKETGYPAELLSSEMELEADLGLDSIKRVEILSALAEKAPSLSPQEQGALAQATTLGDWLAFFAEPSPASPTAAGQAPVGQTPAGQTLAGQTPAGQTPAGQSLVGQAPPGLPNHPKASLGPNPAALATAPSPSPAPDPPRSAAGPAGSAGPAGPAGPGRPTLTPRFGGNGRDKGNGRAILDAALEGPAKKPSLFQVEPEAISLKPGLSPWPAAGLARLVGADSLTRGLEKELKARGYRVERHSWRYDFEKWRGQPTEILFLVWPGPDRSSQIVTQALKALEIAGPSLKALIGLSFLGGSFGFPRPTEGVVQGNSISGALVGLLKCAAWEWPGVFTRALDLPLAVYEIPNPGWIAAIAENAAAPGPVELGLAAVDRLTALTLKPYSPQESPDPLLNPGDTVVVTGGGRGVTAAVLMEMARLYRPRLVILGRTPIGPAEPEWLASLATDREIKAALHRDSGGVLTPKELGERAKLVLSSRELKRNLARLAEVGAIVEYVAGDFTKPSVLEGAARRVRAKFGPIRGFIHGAGVLADHPILGKNHDDFARVYATKTQIAANLLEAFQPEPLKLVVFFSSSTARFGRQGQADYAAGNEVLNKTAWELSLLHPQARVLAVNWGPWAGGMVSETLAGQFRAEGVGLIGLKEGAECFVKLIRSPVGDPAEVVVLGQGTDLEALTEFARGAR